MTIARIAAFRGDAQDVARIGNGVRVWRIARVQYALTLPAAMVLIAVACLVSGCKSAKVTGEHSFAATPAPKPAVIYVADFELGAQDIQHQDDILPGGSRMPGRVRGLLSGEPKWAATEIR